MRAGVGNKARFLNCIASESFCGRPGPKSRDEMDTEKYLPELMAEKDKLDPTFHHSLRLLDQGTKRKHPNLLWDVCTVKLRILTYTVWALLVPMLFGLCWCHFDLILHFKDIFEVLIRCCPKWTIIQNISTLRLFDVFQNQHTLFD